MRERDLAGRDGGFIAEGEVVLRVLARSPLCRARSLLISERRLERLAPLIGMFADEVEVFAAAQQVMDAVVGFPIHRGVLAFGSRARAPTPAELLASHRPGGVVLALFGVSNHDNIGGLFRNAAAFGVEGILVDAACADPLYRKAIRVSVGGTLLVPFARLAAGEDPVPLLGHAGLEALALTPGGETPLASLAASGDVAVLLGSEGQGLPPDLLARCRRVAIPMAGGFDSLNIATTSGIVLHHLMAARPGD